MHTSDTHDDYGDPKMTIHLNFYMNWFSRKSKLFRSNCYNIQANYFNSINQLL